MQPVHYQPTQSVLQNSEPCKDNYNPFVSDGLISLTADSEAISIKILRDTGETQSILEATILPLSEETSIEASMLVQGVELGVLNVPLHKVYLQSELITGPVIVGVQPTLPVQEVSLPLGNDLAGGKVKPEPKVVSNLGKLLSSAPASDGQSETFPACVVMKATAKKMQEQEGDNSDNSQLASGKGNSPIEESHDLPMASDLTGLPVTHSHLLADKAANSEVLQYRLAQGALSEEEAGHLAQCFYIKSEILMRKWCPHDVQANEEWQVVY